MSYYEDSNSSYVKVDHNHYFYTSCIARFPEFVRKAVSANQANLPAETLYDLVYEGKYLTPEEAQYKIRWSIHSENASELSAKVFALFMLARQCFYEIEEPLSRTLSKEEFWKNKAGSIKAQVILHIETTIEKNKVKELVDTSHLKPYKGGGGL